MRRPSPALVVASVALFSSMTGGAVAAKLITGKQVKDNSLTGKDIKDRSIAAKDLAAGARKAGPAGPAGPRGADGTPGAAGLKGDQGIPGPIEGTPAGGALAGTYPAPTLKPASVGPAQIAVPAVILRKSADQSSSGGSVDVFWDVEVTDS